MAEEEKVPIRKLSDYEFNKVCEFQQVTAFEKAGKQLTVLGILLLVLGITAYEYWLNEYFRWNQYYGILILFCGATLGMCLIVAVVVTQFKNRYRKGVIELEYRKVEKVMAGDYFNRYGTYLLIGEDIFELERVIGTDYFEGQEVLFELLDRKAPFTIEGQIIKRSLPKALLEYESEMSKKMPKIK